MKRKRKTEGVERERERERERREGKVEKGQSEKERGKQKERTREKTALFSQKRDGGRRERERETLRETERNMADGLGIFFLHALVLCLGTARRTSKNATFFCFTKNRTFVENNVFLSNRQH